MNPSIFSTLDRIAFSSSGERPDKLIVKMARELQMMDKALDFRSAKQFILQNNPELAEAYIKMNFKKRQ